MGRTAVSIAGICDFVDTAFMGADGGGSSVPVGKLASFRHEIGVIYGKSHVICALIAVFFLRVNIFHTKSADADMILAKADIGVNSGFGATFLTA